MISTSNVNQLFHDTSMSTIDRVTIPYHMIHQQAMLKIVSLFQDTSTGNVNDRVKQC